MKTVCFISCVKKKFDYKTKAKLLYCSPLFKYQLKYAEYNFDEVYILSAKYGLITLNKKIEPYEKTLNGLKKSDIILWSEMVTNQIKEKFDVNNYKFYVLAGKNYYQFINIPLTPLFVLPIGKKLQILKEEIKRYQNV